MTKRFREGDWIVNEDGICQVFGSIDYYVEEFFKHEFENLRVGDVFDTKVVYKIFCHFDGTPRKAKFFNCLSGKYCEDLDGEYQNIFEACKTSNPNLYDKFLKRKPSKPLTSRVEFSLRFEPHVRENAIEITNELFEGIEKPFSYEEFDARFRAHHNTELPENLYAPRDVMMTNTLVSLVYDILQPRNKKFSFLDGVAVRTYCPYDEQAL